MSSTSVFSALFFSSQRSEREWKQLSSCSNGRLDSFSFRIQLISSINVSGMQFLARDSLRMFWLAVAIFFSTPAPFRLMQLFSRSISSIAENALPTRYSFLRRQLSDILQLLRVSLRSALFLLSMKRMRLSNSHSTSFLESIRYYNDRLPYMPSHTKRKSFSHGDILIRLNFFSPQFLLRQYLMLKNRSPSPSGFQSRMSVQRVRLPLISRQKYQKPCEVMRLALIFRQERFMDMEFLLQKMPNTSVRLFIPVSPRLLLERSSLIRGTLLRLCMTVSICLAPMSFLDRLRHYKVVLVMPQKTARAPSLPSWRWLRWSESIMQVGVVRRIRRGYAPSAVSLFLLMGYPVEIFSLQSVGTSLRTVNSTLAPVFPMLTETRDSSLSGNLLMIGANLVTPSSPSGLLSKTSTVTCPYSNI